MNKTVLEEVKDKITAIENKRIEEKLRMQEEIAKSKREEEAARKDLQAAASKLDTSAYAKAAEQENAAHTRVRMYEEKIRQLQAQEDISEEESDKIIDSLLAYSKQLDERFTEEIKQKAGDLQKMLDAYTDEAREVDLTITYWTENIHENHNTRGRTTYYVDGKPTHRSPQPVPVIMRRGPWKGCGASDALKEFLNRLERNGYIFDTLGGGASW